MANASVKGDEGCRDERENHAMHRATGQRSRFGYVPSNTHKQPPFADKKGEGPAFAILQGALFLSKEWVGGKNLPSRWQVYKAACCGQTNYLSNYDLPLNHMIFPQSCGQLKPG